MPELQFPRLRSSPAFLLSRRALLPLVLDSVPTARMRCPDTGGCITGRMNPGPGLRWLHSQAGHVNPGTSPLSASAMLLPQVRMVADQPEVRGRSVLKQSVMRPALNAVCPTRSTALAGRQRHTQECSTGRWWSKVVIWLVMSHLS